MKIRIRAVFSRTCLLALVGVPLTIAVLFSASGCVAPVQPVAVTQSGKPEVTIRTKDTVLIKALLISEMVNHGFTIESDTPYSLAMTRPLSGGEQFAASLMAGNSYSTNVRLTSFMFAPMGDSIRVIASSAIRAQMPGGQVHMVPVEGNGNVFNVYYAALMKIKSEAENQGATKLAGEAK